MVIAHSLSTTLAERGHDVTMVSPFKLSKPIKNHREILVPFDEEALNSGMKKAFENPNQSFLKTLPWVMDITFNLANKSVKLPEFQKILKEENFDLVIIGMFFNNFLLGFGDHFKCPTIMLSSFGNSIITNKLTGNPIESSTVASMQMSPVDPLKMTFSERVSNFLMAGGEILLSTYVNYKMKIVYE
jgi:hypothetical protein